MGPSNRVPTHEPQACTGTVLYCKDTVLYRAVPAPVRQLGPAERVPNKGLQACTGTVQYCLRVAAEDKKAAKDL
jgi:hypothetical protein